MLALSKYPCDQCDKTYRSRAGLWKHKKSKHSKDELQESSGDQDAEMRFTLSEDPVVAHEAQSPVDTSDQSDDPPKWMDFDFGIGGDETDIIPSTLKAIAKPQPKTESKLTKAQRSALKTQNIAMLKMGLSGIDHGLTKYGRAVIMDQDFEVKHSESDKTLVANAQYAWCEEKGLFLTNYLSTGMIASVLTGWYVIPPVLRIRKRSKRKLFRSRGLLSRLPLIGRFFRSKAKPQTEIGQIPLEE